MDDPGPEFEVEIRCHFQNREEAFRVLPFLRDCLTSEISWSTHFYGESLFRSGQLLRASEIVGEGRRRYYIGWKGSDIGTFANIREEIDEEITEGIAGSAIIRRLGGGSDFLTHESVIDELERLGHRRFMAFHGNDVSGHCEALDLKLKLMRCAALRWPLLVELEKNARTEAEAQQREAELMEVSRTFGLERRLVKEEPPALLYETLHPDKQSGSS